MDDAGHVDAGALALPPRHLEGVERQVTAERLAGFPPDDHAGVHVADAGIGFITPNNRFWAAAVAAGLATRDRDPWHAFRHHRVGTTDLVKRATPRAAALSRSEYRDGLARVERLCAWLQPAAVCFVGLAGWRAAADRAAQPGWQDPSLGGSPVYVMLSTSGLNAATPLSDLVDHLRALLAGPPASP